MSYFERPVLVMFTSMPGSGKSYFARQAAERMKAVRLSSDALRPAMRGSIEAWKEAEAIAGKETMHKQLFGMMGYVRDQVLAAGCDLIYDTNTNKRALRKAGMEQAVKFGATPVIVRLEVPYEVALQRGQEREEQADQRQHTEDGMRNLIDRIQDNTDPFDVSEPVVTLDGQKPFEEQFAEFERQAKEIVARG